MKQHTSLFEEELKKLGREIDVVITYGNTTLREELYKVTPVFEGNILKSIMKQLDVETSVNIPIGTTIHFQFGVKVNGAYEYLDYGNYIVNKNEELKDTKRYKLTCYDKMLYTMKQNEDLGVTYPITIKNYLTAIATKVGLTLKNTSFNNESIQIASEKYLGLEYTYRDILDEIAQATGSSIIINANDELEVIYPQSTGATLDEEYLKDINVTFGEKYGPINAVVLTRSGGSDSIYIRDNESVTQNGLCEIKIEDNQLMNDNNRDEYLQGILAAVDGLYYYINDYSSLGICYLEFGDIYNASIEGMTYQCLMLNDEQEFSGGLTEQVYTEMPEESVTDYTKADKTDRRINETYLIVDKQNQQINGVIRNVSDQNEKILELTATVGELDSKISDATDTTISKESNTGLVRLEGINESEPITIQIRPLGTNISYLYPRNNLYPSNTLYMPDRIIKFKNLTTNEVFPYELPTDILWYSDAIYDEFYLDYSEQICQVTKRVGYNADGTTYALSTPTTRTFEYPTIILTDGDYEVSLPGYNSAYLFVRLMSKNIYTAQFATRVEVKTDINQSARNINLSVDEKLTNYSTTTQMNAAIDLKANRINIEVAKKVNNTDYTHAQIVAKINDSTSQVQISADKINLSGYVTVSGLSGGTTTINGACLKTGTIDASQVNITNLSARSITTGSLSANRLNGGTISGSSINLGNGKFVVNTSGALTATNATITGTINATSGTIGGCNITNGTLYVNNANINSINGSKISNSSIVGDKISSVYPSSFTSGTVGVNNFVIETDSGFIKCGYGVDHPYVSALNVGYGSGGISFRNGTSVGNVGTQVGSIFMDLSSGSNVMYLHSSGGINLCYGTLRVIPDTEIITPAVRANHLWIGDHVINDDLGSQVSMDYNLDLWSAQGYHVRANGSQVGGDNSTLNIKQNVKERDISGVLDILEQIKIYDYNYIPEFYGGKKSYGYIIDYLEKIPGLKEYVHFVNIDRNPDYPTKVVENQEEWIKFLLACVIELNKRMEGK